MNNSSEKLNRKRKAFLVIPLIALPFITLACWSLGIVGNKPQEADHRQQGINVSLPKPQMDTGTLDKMSLYSQAAPDSVPDNRIQQDSLSAGTATPDLFTASPSATGISSADAGEARIKERLNQLQQSINRPPSPYDSYYNTRSYSPQDMEAYLARMQQSLGQHDVSPVQDPEMAQLNGMLEKILDIQHPDRLKDQLREQSLKNKGRVYPVGKPQQDDRAAMLTASVKSNFKLTSHSGFYDIGDDAEDDSIRMAAIAAVTEQNQTVTAGATVKLRLSENIMVNGMLVPRNNFVFGICSVDGERLKIEITNVRYGTSLYPVNLSVYDQDGIEGIRIPGAIGRDASKEGADRAIQSVQLMSLDPSIGAQAATAGVEAAKGLFSKKVKLVRVTVKAGYPVLLLDQKAKQENNQ